MVIFTPLAPVLVYLCLWISKINGVVKHLGRKSKQQERIIKNTVLDASADFVELTTDQPFVKPLTNLFMKRSMRLK